MEKDLDIKLYNEYLNGEKDAFELLYNKYKDKVQYFVYNIVRDYQKAEDITQDVFIYIMHYFLLWLTLQWFLIYIDIITPNYQKRHK